MADIKASYLACPIRQVVSRFGDKWSMLVLYLLHNSNTGVLRFNEISPMRCPMTSIPWPFKSFSTPWGVTNEVLSALMTSTSISEHSSPCDLPRAHRIPAVSATAKMSRMLFCISRFNVLVSWIHRIFVAADWRYHQHPLSIKRQNYSNVLT